MAARTIPTGISRYSGTLVRRFLPDTLIAVQVASSKIPKSWRSISAVRLPIRNSR